jgi:SAM-dependent methyltransferase
MRMSQKRPVSSPGLIYLLARVLAALGGLAPTWACPAPEPSDLRTAVRQAQERTEVMLALFRRPPTVGGKTVLDLGCGLGGAVAHCAARGAERVLGLEIDPARARAAHRHIQQRDLSGTAWVVIGDAARPPFRSESFDLVMAIDTLEHLVEPDRALQACSRISRPGGTILMQFMPWYSPWGAHLWEWIRLPWIQLWLPRPCLLAAVREIDRVRQVNARRPQPIRVDWHDDRDPAHVRKLTVARFERSLGRLEACVEQLTRLPIGFRAWRPVAGVLNGLVALPVLRELLTGLVLCMLRKEKPGVGERVNRPS